MSYLFWPQLFADRDCVEDRLDPRSGLRIRRFVGSCRGSVLEADIELGDGSRIPQSDPDPADRSIWREYTPPACTRCDLILPGSERMTRLEPYCACPRCGGTRFGLRSYEVTLEGPALSLRSRLAERLAGVYGEGYDQGKRLLAFRTTTDAGMYILSHLKLGPGCSIPCSAGQDDHDTPRCVSCGLERGGNRPLGVGEHCLGCGNCQWEVTRYQVTLYGEAGGGLVVTQAEAQGGDNGTWSRLAAHCAVWALFALLFLATVGAMHR